MGLGLTRSTQTASGNCFICQKIDNSLFPDIIKTYLCLLISKRCAQIKIWVSEIGIWIVFKTESLSTLTNKGIGYHMNMHTGSTKQEADGLHCGWLQGNFLFLRKFWRKIQTCKGWKSLSVNETLIEFPLKLAFVPLQWRQPRLFIKLIPKTFCWAWLSYVSII